MTPAAQKSPGCPRVSKSAAKNVPATGKISAGGIFGMLPDWKIDAQAFRDEMRR